MNSEESMTASQKLILVFGSLVCMAIVAGAAAFLLWQPYSVSDTQTQQFIVSPKETTSEIADQLAKAHLIKMSFVFKVEVKRQGVDQKLKAGSFNLSPSMTLTQIVQALTTGDKLNGEWVTIPEGKRREEVAEILSNSQLPKFNAQDFIDETANKEGYLFPDTYLIPPQATAGAIITTMTNTFNQKVTVGLAPKLKVSGHSLSDVVIMASIVEREAKSYDDMRLVSGVLWKRMSIGMALQSDVVDEYLHGYEASTKSWWGNSTAADRQSSSPFNSYLTVGLPPHPISNPGLNAINATLDPIITDDLFYLSDDQGHIHTAKTLNQHDQNINTYLK